MFQRFNLLIHTSRLLLVISYHGLNGVNIIVKRLRLQLVLILFIRAPLQRFVILLLLSFQNFLQVVDHLDNVFKLLDTIFVLSCVFHSV